MDSNGANAAIRAASDEIVRALNIVRLVRSGTHVLRFASNRAAHLRWAESYLWPYCRFEADAEAALPLVATAADPARLAVIRARLAGLPTIPGPAYDANPAHAVDECWLGDDLLVQLFRRRPALNIIDRARGIALFLASGADREAKYQAHRLIREVLAKRREAQGQVLFHAAAVEVGGVGVLIVGPRGAGKTTLTLGLIEHHQAQYVANDRVYFGRDEAGFVVEPVPAIVRIGVGTCLRHHWLRPWLAGEHPLTQEQDQLTARSAWSQLAVAAPREIWENREKIVLTTRELCASANLVPRLESRPVVVLFPTIDRECGHGNLVPIPPAEAHARLRAESLVDEPTHPDWLHLRHEPLAAVSARADRLLGAFAEGATCLAVHYREVAQLGASLATALGRRSLT